MPYILRLALIALLATQLSCGWHLRGGGNQNAPTEIHLSSQDPYSPIALTFKDTMQRRAINNSSSAHLSLNIGAETLKKRTVAVTNIGSPLQYELSLSVDYRYTSSTDDHKPKLADSASVYRVFDFDPSNTVAKNEEENTLLTEMRRELAHRILRQAPQNSDKAAR